MNEQRIAISADHAGYELKENIKKHYPSVEFGDFGTNGTASVDYPDFVHPMATAIQKGEFDYGIAICGSANGVSMVANRHAGIRAALCWMPEIAHLARQHNNANVLSLPARYLSNEEAFRIIDEFFSTDFEGGRHQARVDKIEC
ncbi:MAG: ribose 5-phosphate isomerase B [Prevotellaceae bacterium]|nr:ribose 5-phosphate isomerase B [Prevotellaceae bacterium]